MALALLHATGNHGLVRQHRGETLVVLLQWHIGKDFSEAVNEGLDILHRLGVFATHLIRMANNHLIDLLLREIIGEPRFERVCGDRNKRISRYTEGIRNG